jgi:putative membrane protein
MGVIFSFLIFLVASAVVIYIVSRLNLGLTVASFTSAIIAALVIAVVSAVVLWLLGLIGIGGGAGLIGAIVSLIIAAVVLLISARFVPGMQVNGFSGAIIAANGLAVVSWILSWLLGLFGIVL